MDATEHAHVHVIKNGKFELTCEFSYKGPQYCPCKQQIWFCSLSYRYNNGHNLLNVNKLPECQERSMSRDFSNKDCAFLDASKTQTLDKETQFSLALHMRRDAPPTKQHKNTTEQKLTSIGPGAKIWWNFLIKHFNLFSYNVCMYQYFHQINGTFTEV